MDDKLKTKRLALEAGIAVPQLYGVIETQHDIRTLPDIVRSHNEFALKPAHGSAGDGIVVIAGRSGNRYRTIGGEILDEDFLSHHLSNAINGQFSLGGVQDVVIVEYMVRFSPLFERISYEGVPDIRVIVFRGVPVMAMVRLPTRSLARQGEPAPGRGRRGHRPCDRHDARRRDRYRSGHASPRHDACDRRPARAGLGHDPRHLGALLRADRPRLHRRRHRAGSRSAGRWCSS